MSFDTCRIVSMSSNLISVSHTVLLSMNHKRTSVADAVGCYRNVRLHHQPPGGKESNWLPWTVVTIQIYNKKKDSKSNQIRVQLFGKYYFQFAISYTFYNSNANHDYWLLTINYIKISPLRVLGVRDGGGSFMKCVQCFWWINSQLVGWMCSTLFSRVFT